MNQSAEKIKFMECRMAGQPYTFVLQTTPPQYLYQVMEFKDMEQYKAFAQADKGTGMIHAQVGARMMALRLSTCLMDLGLRQDNAKAKTEELYGTIKEAAKWYHEFLNQINMVEKEHYNKISRKDIFEDRVNKIRRKTLKIVSERSGLIIENLNSILDQIQVIEVEITEYTEEVCYHHDNLRIGKIKRIYREDSDILLEMDNGDKILLDRLNFPYLRIVEHIIYSNLVSL